MLGWFYIPNEIFMGDADDAFAAGFEMCSPKGMVHRHRSVAACAIEEEATLQKLRPQSGSTPVVAQLGLQGMDRMGGHDLPPCRRPQQARPGRPLDEGPRLEARASR